MSHTPRPTSFRLPSKYIVFLDMLAADYQSDRSKILVRILELYLQSYLSRSQEPEPEAGAKSRSQEPAL